MSDEGAEQDQNAEEKRRPGSGTRSGDILPPGAGLGWSGTYFHCPEPGCPTRERARPDGSLGSGRCGEHGKVLTRTPPAAQGDAGAAGGQAS